MTESNPKGRIFLYYFSFVLVFATISFIAAMLLFDYESTWDSTSGKTMWAWDTMKPSHKAGYIAFGIMQFPFGLLFGLITGNYNNGLFAFLINPLFIAWILQKFFQKRENNFMKFTLWTNYIIWVGIIFSLAAYFSKQ